MSKASSNFRVKNIGNVFELSGVAFRLAKPYGGLLVFSKPTIMLDIAALVCSQDGASVTFEPFKEFLSGVAFRQILPVSGHSC